MLILSADPGITGAICAYDTQLGRVTVHDMPVVVKKMATGVRRLLDEVEIITMFRLYAERILEGKA